MTRRRARVGVAALAYRDDPAESEDPGESARDTRSLATVPPWTGTMPDRDWPDPATLILAEHCHEADQDYEPCPCGRKMARGERIARLLSGQWAHAGCVTRQAGPT